MIYITGDKHGNFHSIEKFCKENKTTKQDVLIILGDSGLNYYVNRTKYVHPKYEDTLESLDVKLRLAKLPITFFFIQGNHEAPASYVKGYVPYYKFGNTVYFNKDYRNQFFAINGNIYYFLNKKCVVLGGAYSVDKNYRLNKIKNGAKEVRWFPEEQMTDIRRQAASAMLSREDWKVDYVFSHTCREGLMPTDLFLKYDDIVEDRTTEKWLDEIHHNLSYKKWFCGHFHDDRMLDDKTVLMFNDIRQLV